MAVARSEVDRRSDPTGCFRRRFDRRLDRSFVRANHFARAVDDDLRLGVGAGDFQRSDIRHLPLRVATREENGSHQPRRSQ